ncbi:MAG TPA: carboxyl transferase domain-containing protein, partial [Terriglobales bacterium]
MSSNELHTRELARRESQSLSGGGAARQAKHHEQGKLLARERLELLLDPGSFQEFDQLVAPRPTDFGSPSAEQRVPGDGFVTGFGRIDGRTVFVFAQDFTVYGGSL